MIIDHRYEVIESLGSGSWSNVYKVSDRRSGSLYTLKLFQYLSSDDVYERFSAEDMHHITKIEHPNLAHVVDFGHVGDHIYSLSEYYNGKPLSTFRYKKTQLEMLYDIIIQIVYALDALHGQNILHKDLKPENVLYRIEKNKVEVKVIDFGFSKTETSSIKHGITGSLPYLAPEIFTAGSYSIHSDYYALGVLLYKLTTGNFPFTVEQINALLTGTQQYFIPKFPSELNPDVPPELEKFILRLLERHPTNRFESAEDVINYINRIQDKQYPFSVEWSLVNRMKYNSYISRVNYSHQIMEYLDSIYNNNGKIISIVGSDGLGKDSILSLFRYHLLNGKYFLFDYVCTRTDHEPFFALIKEFVQSLEKDSITQYETLKNISEKFSLYLFQSPQEAKKVTQNQAELHADFESVRQLLIELSAQKPIIFIIRNAQYIHKHTIDFINFVSTTIVQHKIIILLSFNEYSKVSLIPHTVNIQIPPLTYQETTDYIFKLLNFKQGKAFVDKIWTLSAGNPFFIREILVDLVQRKKNITSIHIETDQGLEDYELPKKLILIVTTKLHHLRRKHYEYLQYLSAFDVPMTKELMEYVLKLSDKELYEFINDAIYNEIIYKHKEQYFFTHFLAKDHLRKSINERQIQEVSKAMISYYKSHIVDNIAICKGLISSAQNSNDLETEREYSKRLIELYDDMAEQEAAYQVMVRVLKINSMLIKNLTTSQIISDLMQFQKKVEIVGFRADQSDVLKILQKLPDSFEKNYIMGTIYYVSEEYSKAKHQFEKAIKSVVTGLQRIQIWFYFVQIYAQTNLKKMKEYLDLLSELELPLEYKIAYFDRLSLYYKLIGDVSQSVKIAEDFIINLPSVQDSRVLLRLASFHNNLGVNYSTLKNIEEAHEHFNIALSIWKRLNINRYLGLIYNNIADLYLKQGITTTSITYSQKGYEIASIQGFKSVMAQALLNLGEAFIKTGEFNKSEEYLNGSLELIKELKSDKYLESIKVNMALAKSKIKNFKYYLDFISEQEPQLKDGIMKVINPLVKTFFYYLFELGQVKKLTKLLRKNAQIDYHACNEDEFYYNTQSMIAILNQEYEFALECLKNAEKYAGAVNNHYAVTVFYISEIECHIGMKNFEKAEEIIQKTIETAKLYKYNYWLSKLQLLKAEVSLANPKIPVRALLRDLLELKDKIIINEYFLLQIKLFSLLVKTYLSYGADQEAQETYSEYRKLLEKSVEGIDADDRQLFLKNNFYYIGDIKKIDVKSIASRYPHIKSNWHELQYNLMNVQNTDRIKFFIEKGIKDILSPWKFQLMVYEKNLNTYSMYLGDISNGDIIISSDTFQLIDKSFRTDNIILEEIEAAHVMVIPLQIKYHRIGFIILSDRSELKYTRLEISLMKSIKNQITNLIIRIQDYAEITQKMKMMNRLMTITHSLLKIIDINQLEIEIVSACIDFTGSSRGFLIKKDDSGNYIYQIAMDYLKAPLANVSVISKTVLSECQSAKAIISTVNAADDKRYLKAISIQDYKLHTIFCAPILIDDMIYGFIYLDNYLDNTKSLYLDNEIITLLFDQITIAIKNARQYESMVQKAQELQSLETLKDEFMAIVAHELNTPLSTLQGYVSRLKRNLFVDEEERLEIIGKIEANVKKLILSINDIITMNNYNLKTELPKVPIQILDIINLIQHEIEIVSRHRRMIFKIDASKDLPLIDGNWEAIHLMIYNIVLNAIRFTNDFGTIRIGVRRSAFQEEKINNKESLVIYVQDNGIGIPPSQLKNVFRKFYEVNEIYAHKSGTVEYRSSGLGLGLSASRRIAELHNGRIWIKSKENEGTTVFISLPVKQ
jgi:signal transduction histidine kinase/serine/threonine protein kinase/tetratricopeptide (TPR) repeat protein